MMSKKWSEKALVISALRKVYRQYPIYKECLLAAKSDYYVLSKKGSLMRRVRWECAICGNKVSMAEKVVDHKDPVVDPKIGFVDYNTYAKRLFCPLYNLQVLCNSCHKIKCKVEVAQRKSTRRKK